MEVTLLGHPRSALPCCWSRSLDRRLFGMARSDLLARPVVQFVYVLVPVVSSLVVCSRLAAAVAAAKNSITTAAAARLGVVLLQLLWQLLLLYERAEFDRAVQLH